MTGPSDSMDDLTSDIAHLSTLIGIATNMVIDIVGLDKTQCEQTKMEIGQVADLLWIARDMVEQIAKNSEACHSKAFKALRAFKAVKGEAA